jgi:hypothetical protein
MTNEDKATTWGDCPNPDCNFYGRMVYGIEPGDYCGQKREDAGLDANDYCYSELRWYDRWHDGKHSGYHRETGLAACAEQRRRAAMKPHTDDMVDLVSRLTTT